MVGDLVGRSVAPGSSATRLSDVGLPHYSETPGMANNGEKIVPVSNFKSVAYQHQIFSPWKWWDLLLRFSQSTCLKRSFMYFSS